MVDILLTALPAPPDVKILMEDSGVLDAMRPGTIWIAHETTLPEESERFGVLASSKGIRMLEAPLTGSKSCHHRAIRTTSTNNTYFQAASSSFGNSR